MFCTIRELTYSQDSYNRFRIMREKSKTMFSEAKKYIVGGVNSPVRTFASVEETPAFISKGKGSKLWDEEGNEYIDYVMSWGAIILGHADDDVVYSVQKSAEKGLGFGAVTQTETRLAKLIVSAFPAMDQVRFVSSGTEACMTALRLARAYTKRNKFIKFSGNYHGHADPLLVKAGSGLATQHIATSAGVPQTVIQDTLVAPYNDLEAVRTLFQSHKNEISAIIVEPFVGNSGFIRPKDGFLEGLRALCTEEGALLIFDEVMTGFRVAWGGAQTLLNISPDLTTLAKVVGGGQPLAALGGKSEIMSHLAPLGDVYQAGTLSGNPIAVQSGLKTLELLGNKGAYDKLGQITQMLVKGISELAKAHGIPLTVDSEGGMFGLFFSKEPVRSFEDAKKSDEVLFKNFFKGIFNRGIYWAPSLFEAGFVSLSHSEEDLLKTVSIIGDVFKEMKR